MAALDHVHRWLPVSGARDTVLALHGTGGDENDLVPLAREVAPHANVLSPRGNVLENGAPRFFRRHGAGVLDVDDLRKRAGQLADFVAEAAREYGFDPARVVALGYSNGANVALGMLFERPSSLAGAALLRAMVAYEPPAASGALAAKRVLLAAGERDPYSHGPVTEALAGILRARGADVTVSLAPGGHELTQQDLAAARAWFATLIR
jgi:predicted esterase